MSIETNQDLTTICNVTEEIIINDFREALRGKLIEDAVQEYRERIAPIVDASLRDIVNTRVEAVKDIVAQRLFNDEINLNISLDIKHV